MIKKAIKTITLSAAMITMMSVFGHTTKVDAANITGTVTATSLNVRSGASTSYSIVGKVTKGKEVEILSSNNGWYKIGYGDNKTGWSCDDYISKNKTKTGTVMATSLNVRSGSSTSYSIVGKVTKGEEVEILSSSNGWYKIKYSDITGWVSGDYISTSTEKVSENTSFEVAKTLDVKAYAYTGDGITATGTVPKYGTIAVDPSVIPYGTKVYIKELDKVFTAEDCGGAIKGNTIDIFMTSEAACNNWGVKYITLQILK
mgnify:CR=1 FL=1